MAGDPFAGAEMKCTACQATNTPRYLVVTDTVDNSICVDFRACALRYRMGMSPQGYQQYLRAKVLLVTSR